METRTSHYENITIGGESRSHLGNVYNNHYYNHDRQTTARPSRCVSVLPSAVSTYTERPHLTEELSKHLKSAQRGTGVAHAVAVVGIGGAGKTQLALHYIKSHEGEYDTIFWLDARSKETARSSYERCRAMLCLPGGSQLNDQPLEDSPAVQAVLLDLQNRPEGKKWLAVVDNADDPSWVRRVVPRGKEGTVIVTSQDRQAFRLLGGQMEVVKVDAMELEEAMSLMSAFFKAEVNCLDDAHRKLMEDVVVCLDRLPLAVDLASARIRNDVEDGDDLESALRQYLLDYLNHQNQLLRDADFAEAGSYDKTVWTVWDTSLSSVRKVESGKPDVHATRLLEFLTLFDRANVQEELFRKASPFLQRVCSQLRISVPEWLQSLLRNTEAGDWDDLAFRSSLKVLLRYGLVRPVKDDWKGVTMHGLVQWRAGLEMDRALYWRWYLIFLSAACERLLLDQEELHFRRHLVVHIPPNQKLLEFCFGDETLAHPCYFWEIFAYIWSDEGRYGQARQLQAEVVETKIELLGEENRQTLASMANLAWIMTEQGRWHDAEELCVKVIQLAKKVLPPNDPFTLNSTHRLAVIWSNQQRWDEAIDLNKTVLDARTKALPLGDPSITESMHNLAWMYSRQGRSDEAEKLQEEVLAASTKTFGKGHVKTLQNMGNLAITYRRRGRLGEAEKLGAQVLEGMKSAAGERHPYTLQATDHLSRIILAQGRIEEAETLALKANEACERVLPVDHPIAVDCRGTLEEILLMRRQVEEAEAYYAKMQELSLEEEKPVS